MIAPRDTSAEAIEERLLADIEASLSEQGALLSSRQVRALVKALASLLSGWAEEQGA